MNETPSFSIRPARETDVPDILAMIRELAAFENLESELHVTAASLHESLFGAHPAAAALIAVAGSQPVAYAIYFYTFSSFAGRPGIFLEDVYVRPAWRKKGVGQALLQQVARIGVRHHCRRFEWVALRWNENALGFYNRRGAQALDDWVMLRMGEARLKELADGKQPTPAQVP